MNPSILCFLIDDDLDDQDIFVLTLKEIDPTIRCMISNNGVEALEMFEADTLLVPDYIFLDVNMPRMNGFDCIKEIKKIERLKNSILIMYSATSDSRKIAMAKELGITDYIVKPVGTQPLKKALEGVLRKPSIL